MRFAMVLVDAIRADVPATVVAARCFVVATIAKERAAEEELFQPRPCFVIQLTGVKRNVHLVSATLATSGIEAGQERSIMVMDAARHNTLAMTERTSNAELRRDGSADKIALIRQLIEQFGQFALDFEGNDGGLLRLTIRFGGLSGHRRLLCG
jgi:hypothetical protein